MLAVYLIVWSLTFLSVACIVTAHIVKSVRKKRPSHKLRRLNLALTAWAGYFMVIPVMAGDVWVACRTYYWLVPIWPKYEHGIGLGSLLMIPMIVLVFCKIMDKYSFYSWLTGDPATAEPQKSD